MMKQSFVIFLCLVFACPVFAQSKTSYQKATFIRNADTLPYRILMPANYDPKVSYPLVMFLHGSGERGNDNEAQLTHGWKLFLTDSNRVRYPAIVVFPQCPENSFWSNTKFGYDSASKKRIFDFQEEGEPTSSMRALIGLVTELQHMYKVKSRQIYVGGLSMGGMGAFELARRMPKTFAAAFPICGGANPETAKKLRNVNWWIFHGVKDDVVPSQYSELMAKALQNRGADVRLTLYPEANHNSWDSAFAEPALLSWLFSNIR